LPPSGRANSKEKLLKKAHLTLLALLAVAAALTVGCGDSHSIPTFSKLPFVSDRVVSPATPLFLMNLDGSAVTPVSFDLDGIYSPSISADFKTVAFLSGDEVWVSNSDGTSQTQVTNNAASDGFSIAAKLSPDGKKIVSGTWDNSAETYNVWIMNSDGSGQVNLTATKPSGMDGCYEGSFSADSKRIVFACYSDADNTYGLFLINPDGSALATVSVQSAFFDTPIFAPDGQHVLYMYYPFLPGVAAHKPAFRKGPQMGRQLARQHAQPEGTLPSQGLYSSNLDGSGSTLVVANTYEAEILNSTIYFTQFNPDLDLSQIYKANLDGTGAVAVSDGTADDWLNLAVD
jgi:hypothetical protein